MKLSSSAHYALFLLSSVLGLSSADSSHLNDDTPCVARSPTTGLYFDLSALSLSPPELKDGKKVVKDARDDSWHAKGHDYPANFTINICAPVVENVTDVVGIESSRWKNVSAYYERDNKVYSIGYGSSLPNRSSLWIDTFVRCANVDMSHPENKLLSLSSVAASSSSITPMARRVQMKVS
jgi:cation-dependent mannose-6-phosphate receptor